MRLRWKDHELFFITVLVVVQIFSYFAAVYAPGLSSEIDTEQLIRGNAIRNLLMPQVVSVLLLYGAYLAVVFQVVPLILKIRFQDVEKMISQNLFKPVFFILVFSFALALGINALAFYARPWEVSYRGFGNLALFGYNEHPLENIFFGFGRALSYMLIVTIAVCFREFISWLLTRNKSRREYRILITNNTTALLLIFFVALLLINPVNYDFRLLISYVLPVIILYLVFTFRIFPAIAGKPFFDKKFWLPVLLVTLLALIPGFIFVTPVSGHPFMNFVYGLFLIVICYPLFWIVYRMRADQIRQLRGMQTALAQSTANLQHLRSQINPHFLFNALNTLYGTSLMEKADRTAEGIQRLGDMMRFMLHENSQDFISMGKELEYLKNYLALQKLRTQTSAEIVIEDNLDEAVCNRTIAPMLLIPFIENAFKHGISLKSPSWISIQLKCTPGELEFQVANSVHLKYNYDPEHGNSGIGLQNVSERLKLLYPGKHNLHIRESESEYVIKLTIY